MPDRDMLEALAFLIQSERSAMLTDYLNSPKGRVHTKAACKATRKAGGPKGCVIHKPTLHRLTGRPQILRSTTLIEDQCVHGVGHPNPDSADYLNWRDGYKSDVWGVHGCDGCCGPLEPKAPRLCEDINPGWPPQD